MSCSHHCWPAHICYFCKGKPWKTTTLADGCAVPICTVCYPKIEQGKKLAQERVYYDPSRLSNSRDIQPQDGGYGNTGASTMKAEKHSEGGNFLKVKNVVDDKITELKIVGEVKTVEFEKEKDGKKVTVTKYQAEISYEGMKDDSPNIWTMNHPSSNALIDTWGDDTDNWKDKVIPLTIAGDGEYKHFKVDSLRIK